MIDLKKIYDSLLDEDAVMAAGAGAVGRGEIAAPSGVGDADIVQGGMTTTDVLGKDCDHHKDGYLGPGCFHVPSRVCKLKREIPSGIKKKGQKNLYAKGMKILTDDEKLTTDLQKDLKAKKQIEKTLELASDVKDKSDVKKAIEQFDDKKKDIDKRFDNSKFKEVKDGLVDIISMLKDVCAGKYKCKWSTIAILTGAILYVLSPVDLIPDALPVIGIIDDATVIMWVLDAFKDEFNKYKKSKTDESKIVEAELDRKTILAIHKVKESTLRNFIRKFFRDEIYDAMYVKAIAYFPPSKTFFAKVENDGKWSYVNLDFKNGKFTLTDDLNVYTGQEIKEKYSDLYGIRCWICWGGI